MAVAKKKSAPKKAVKKKTAAKKKATTKKAKAAPKKAVKKKAPAKKAKAKTTAKKKAAPKKAVAKKSTAKKKAAVKKTKDSPKASVKKRAPAKRTKVKQTDLPAATIAHGEITPYQAKRGEEYMNDGQKEHFLNILTHWKRELMEEVDRTVHHMQDDAANFPDPNDRASQESDFALELRTRDRERKLIKKIDEAIAMLDSDEYGYCEVCGIEIGIRRLEARPTATLCIDCKTLDEIREKQINI
ncbi:MAG: RNA polymerase-binding protein DksA [Gammaproteobacteria bacterium]